MSRVRPATSEAGFVLMGVIMFVLALTILGLSLFSLSGYEVQFLEESRQDLQAFYAASGGIERAKLMLQTKNTLDAVTKTLPVEGVVYARARYVGSPADSGNIPVDWSGDGNHDLEIRVLAVERGKRRMVEARYRPSRASSIYENLLVSAGKILVPYVDSQLILEGTVKQNSSNTGWRNAVLPPAPTPSIGGVPVPDSIGEYINAHSGSAVTLPWGVNWDQNPTMPHEYNLISPGAVQFYRAPTGRGRSDFAFGDGSHVGVTLNVSGTAIWLLPGGVTFEASVTVIGTPDDRLVIVATKSAETGDALPGTGVSHTAIHFEGGLHSPLVPIILVSNGPIAIEQRHWDTGEDDHRTVIVPYLTAFGSDLVLGGPEPGAPAASATYAHDSSRDAAVLDPLITAGLLPNTTPGQYRRFLPLAGTWREVTESNPN